MLSLMILLMMITMFAAAFPLVVRSANYSNNYTQAAFLAQHKIDQIRAAGWDKTVDTSKLSGSNDMTLVSSSTGSSMTSLGIIDPGQSYSSSGGYTFTSVDGLTGYFPAGSSGAVTIQPYAPATGCSSGATCSMAQIVVTISWTGGGLNAGSYKLVALMFQNPQ